MKDRAWVVERLRQMDEYWAMWASTREGYLLQVMVMLEMIDIDSNKVRDGFGALKAHLDGGLNARPLTKDFVTLVQTEAKRLLLGL